MTETVALLVAVTHGIYTMENLTTIKAILGAGLSYIIILLLPLMDKVDLISLILQERAMSNPGVGVGRAPVSQTLR